MPDEKRPQPSYRTTASTNKSWFARRRERGVAPKSARRTMTAAAARIDLASKSEARRARLFRQGWQQDSMTYADIIPEISFAFRFLANCSRRMRIFPAAIDPNDPDAEPISLRAAGASEQAIESCDRAMATLGGRLAKAAIMDALSWGLGVPGECYLVGMPEAETGEETWRIRSIDEFVVMEDAYKLREVPMDPQGVQGWVDVDPETAFVSRLWVPHHRFSLLANSPMRALADVAEELLLLSRDIRATARSRLNSGLMKVPNGLRLESFAEDNDDPESDSFLGPLFEMMMTPISDEGVASAVVPGVVTGEPESLKELEHMLIERPYSALAMELRSESIRRIANGLDVPASVVLGMEEANHWSAWQISDDTFRHHVEPNVLRQVDALTVGYLRPWFDGDSEMDPAWVDKIVMWYDPVELVRHPDRTADAIQLHTRLAISDAALRREAGFGEDDAPLPEEIELRMVRNTKTFPPNVLEALFHVLDPNLPIPPIEQSGQIPGMGPKGAIPITPPPPKDGEDGQPLPSLPPAPPSVTPPSETAPSVPVPQNAGLDHAALDVASFAVNGRTIPSVNVRLSRKMTLVDRELRSKLSVAASAAMTRTLERAGAKIRTRSADRKFRAALSDAQRAAIAAVPNSEVAATLGQTVVAAMGFASSKDVLSTDWSDLADQYQQWVKAAQQQAVRLASQIAGVDQIGLSSTGADELGASQDAAAATGWNYLSSALDGMAERLLYNPNPSAQDVITIDPNALIPTSDIRASVALAGGADLANDGTVDSSTGIANGPDVLGAMDDAGMEVASYEWVHNYSGDKPLSGHEDLDGQTFDSFTDDTLLNTEDDWIGTEYYIPGDHDGCVCDYTCLWVEGAAESAGPGELNQGAGATDEERAAGALPDNSGEDEGE